jgi:myo-inositol-1(or 4)-monophosphatase
MNGSAATAICYVAAGRFDLWGEAFIGRWDFSAGALIVEEAGGRVTDIFGNANYLESHHIVASNAHLHQAFIDLYAEALPKGM